MARKAYSCGICENVNLPSVCAPCVNCRLNDKNKWINALKREHISLNKRLDEKLKAKDKAGDQRRWMQLHAEKIVLLKERLRLKEDQLMNEKFKLEEKTNEFHYRETLLADAYDVLKRNVMEKLEKFYPDEIRAQNLALTTVQLDLLQAQSVAIRQLGKFFPLCKAHDGDGSNKGLGSNDYHHICSVRLPQGTNPHSVSAEELGASLGYMLQLLNLVVRYLYAPLLLSSGLAGSCSRVWQRASYWNSQPASRSKEHPLFIPHQIGSIASQGNSRSSDYGVASMESVARTHPDSAASSSFSYGSRSLHSIQTHRDLEEGICLLKKSVACVTANVFNSFCLPSPTQLSTFEGFEKMLAFVCSKDARALLSSNEAKSSSRSRRHLQPPNKLGIDQSVDDSRISSSSLGESKHAKTVMPNNLGEDQSVADSRTSSSSLRESKHKSLPRDGSRRITSLVYPNQLSDVEKAESALDEWDMVEHPTLPPPSSLSEDIEHWTRAMMLKDKGNDAKRR